MAYFVSVLGDLGLGKTKTKRFFRNGTSLKSHGTPQQYPISRAYVFQMYCDSVQTV